MLNISQHNQICTLVLSLFQWIELNGVESNRLPNSGRLAC